MALINVMIFRRGLFDPLLRPFIKDKGVNEAAPVQQKTNRIMVCDYVAVFKPIIESFLSLPFTLFLSIAKDIYM